MFLRAKSAEEFAAVSRIVDQGLRVHPCNPALLLIAGRIAMKQGDIVAVYQQYRYCISYCNDNSFFWCGLGVIYFKNDQTQDAIVAFQRALYLKSEMCEPWLNIGLIFEQQGDFTSAQKIYLTGQAKCPGVQDFADRLGALAGAQRPACKPGNWPLIDIDDMKFIIAPAEMFAKDYVAAVPELPPQCFGIEAPADGFGTLATFPRSYFA
jgi:tetratricopeptide (TPR) repeat protein